MKMDKVAGSGNDEFFTPHYAVEPILEYVPRDAAIWCPFDQPDSSFVRALETRGNKVVATHLDSGHDFFDTPVPQGTDFIISNPPYSLKTEVLQRLFSLGTPFAMLLGVVGLFESQRRFEMFRDNEFEVMYFNRRVSYLRDPEDEKPALNPPFSSVYICHKMLPEKIVFTEIDKKRVHLKGA